MKGSTAVIVAVLAMGWMASGCVPKAQMEAQRQEVKSKLDAIAGQQTQLSSRQDEQAQRMQEQNARLDAIEQQLAAMENDVAALQKRKAAAKPRRVERVVQKRVVQAPAPAVRAEKPAVVAEKKPLAAPTLNDEKVDQDFNASLMLLKGGDYPKAIQALSQFIKRYPHSSRTAEARYWLGEAYYAEGDDAGVIETLAGFTNMPAATPKRAAALLRLATSYRKVGRSNDAVAVLQRLRLDHAGSIEAEEARKQLQQIGSAAVATQTKAVAEPVAAKPVRKSLHQPVVTKAAARKHGWAVNIVSVDNLPEAKQEIERLHAAGFDVEMVDVQVKGKTWHRLRVTGYESAAAAERELKKAVAAGYSDAWTSPE